MTKGDNDETDDDYCARSGDESLSPGSVPTKLLKI